jgi:hypothetical protein
LKRKKTKGVKRYHSYKIKIDKKTKKLKGELIKHKTSFKSVQFDSPFPVIPEKKQITTTTTTIKNYLDNINTSEFGGYSNDSFFNAIGTPYIPNILNSVNNKYYLNII